LNQQVSATSTLRIFCPDYFPHFASGLEPRHIGARPKGTPFRLGCFETGAIYTAFCLGSVRTEAIGDKYFFLIQIFAGFLASVMVRTEAICELFASVLVRTEAYSPTFFLNKFPVLYIFPHSYNFQTCI